MIERATSMTAASPEGIHEATDYRVTVFAPAQSRRSSGPAHCERSGSQHLISPRPVSGIASLARTRTVRLTAGATSGRARPAFAPRSLWILRAAERSMWVPSVAECANPPITARRGRASAPGCMEQPSSRWPRTLQAPTLCMPVCSVWRRPRQAGCTGALMGDRRGRSSLRPL